MFPKTALQPATSHNPKLVQKVKAACFTVESSISWHVATSFPESLLLPWPTAHAVCGANCHSDTIHIQWINFHTVLLRAGHGGVRRWRTGNRRQSSCEILISKLTAPSKTGARDLKGIYFHHSSVPQKLDTGSPSFCFKANSWARLYN